MLVWGRESCVGKRLFNWRTSARGVLSAARCRAPHPADTAVRHDERLWCARAVRGLHGLQAVLNWMPWASCLFLRIDATLQQMPAESHKLVRTDFDLPSGDELRHVDPWHRFEQSSAKLQSYDV